MVGKKVLVVMAHPVGSYGAALAVAYIEHARRTGLEVRTLELNALKFDPILRLGYRVKQPLEPDLEAAQDLIHWANHLAFFFPVWWGSVPAVLKGFLDRVLLPGFAFKYRPGKKFPEQLLTGRTAHIVATMDTPPWYFKWIYCAPALRQMKANTLQFCGIRPVRTLAVGPVMGSSPAQREDWLRRTRKLASQI